MKTNDLTKTSTVNSRQVTIKLIIIFGLILALLIPQTMIKGLVKERKLRQKEVEENIAQQIGSYADVVGPVLAVPFKTEREVVSYNKKNEKEMTIVYDENTAFFTAESLSIHSFVNVNNKDKGIYKVPFFQSENKLTAKFQVPDFNKIETTEELIEWEKAKLLIDISDVKGIGEIPTAKIKDEERKFQPGNKELISNTIEIPITKEELSEPVEITFMARGTTALNFASTAKSNQLEMKSNWTHPNFESTTTHYTGNQPYTAVRQNSLPTEKEIHSDGFTATWKENQFSMNQKTTWLATEKTPNLKSRLMGAEFMNVSDHYKKSERSVKYMAMIIALIFVCFFIIELLKSTRIHPFQYVMVGAAIAVFFILLLAISEYIGFDLAYLFAALATIALIGLYSLSVFKSKSLATSVTIMLTVLFTFIFTILKAAEYSLLLGAIGLFVMIALIMYTTRKIQWYQQ